MYSIPTDGLDFDKELINSVRIEKDKVIIHLSHGVYTVSPESDYLGCHYLSVNWFGKPLPKDMKW